MVTAGAPLAQRVFVALADGTAHSGAALAERAGVTRSAVWKAIESLRAEARSVVAEMHSGFTALRTHLPMAIRERIDGRLDRPGVAADLARVFALWRRCRSRHGSGGAFLFGAWSAGDTFFAPVVMRIRTYGAILPDDLAPYIDAVLAHPHVREWEAEAVREPWTVVIE